jgi:hypothetical protein
MNVQISVNFTDADQTAFGTLTAPSDQQTFIVAKLAAQCAPALEAAIASSNILALLSPADQEALGGLITAVQAMPSGGGF